MADLTRAYYELVFENNFLKRRGSAFQDFFSEIMEKCYPGDFARVRPWGKIGDRKNDGYLASEKTLFQVYAPNEMKAAEAVAKIEEDFSGALPHWREYFGTWAFVHNARDGLGPDVAKKLLDLGQQHKPLKVIPWDFEQLRQRAFRLGPNDLASLLGPAPSRKAMLNVGFEELKVVLQAIARQRLTPEQEVRPVSPRKLFVNGLSESVKDLLTAGMNRSELVGRYFQECTNPRPGDEVATSFSKKYLELRAVEQDPDVVFRELQLFAGGSNGGMPEHEAAVLAVLAFLFEQCDIFDDPREEGAP